MTKKQTITLTKIFSSLSDLDNTKESLGSDLLSFLRDNDCVTIDQANYQFGIAYDENGWSRSAGRPKEGATETPAPATVKNYVSTLRRAYNAEMDVLSFSTMWELRVALRELRDADRQTKQPALRGVQVAKVDVINGALWHDLVVVWEHLPEDERGSLEAKLERLLSQFIKKAPLTLAAAA